MQLLKSPHFALVAAASIVLWAPLAHMEWFWGHERASYVWRTIEWAAELRAGRIYPRWCPDFYGGYGSPLFMFYGPVLYAVAGLLTATVTNVFWGLKIVALLGSLASGLGAYALILGETRQRDAALFGALAFLAAPYRIGNLYLRGDIGEYSCLALLPVVLALYRASYFEPRPERARWLSVGAALFHAVLILTHPVLGLWGSLIIGFVVLVSVISLARRRFWRRALELSAALGAAACLAGLYTVPALIDRQQTHTAGMVINFYNPQNHWLTLGTLFEDSTRLFDPNFMKAGTLIVLALGFVALGLFFDRGIRGRAFGWLLLCFALIGLNLPEMSWFWAPNRLPLVVFIQFPWRLIGPASLAACVALGVGSAAVFRRLSEGTRLNAIIAVSTLLFVAMSWRFTSVTEMKTAGVAHDPETVRAGMVSATDADEYLPLAVRSPPSAPAHELVLKADGAEVKLAHSDGSRHAISVKAQRAGASLTLGVYAFPGWAVETVKGPRDATLGADAKGLIRLRLPATGEYRLRVEFGPSRAAWLGYGVSAIGVLVLGFLLAWPWYRGRFRAKVPPAQEQPVTA